MPNCSRLRVLDIDCSKCPRDRFTMLPEGVISAGSCLCLTVQDSECWTLTVPSVRNSDLSTAFAFDLEAHGVTLRCYPQTGLSHLCFHHALGCHRHRHLQELYNLCVIVPGRIPKWQIHLTYLNTILQRT